MESLPLMHALLALQVILKVRVGVLIRLCGPSPHRVGVLTDGGLTHVTHGIDYLDPCC